MVFPVAGRRILITFIAEAIFRQRIFSSIGK
jgi:hypothetical protein